jgi:hypothetical protein
MDLKIQEVTLEKAQARDINLWENRDLLVELVELPRHLAVVERDHFTEAEELAALVAKISMVLVDLRLAPIQGIPQVPNKV